MVANAIGIPSGYMEPGTVYGPKCFYSKFALHGQIRGRLGPIDKGIIREYNGESIGKINRDSFFLRTVGRVRKEFMEQSKKRGRKPMSAELKKIQRNISVDPVIWEAVREFLPGLASSICEKALERAVKQAKRGRDE